MAIPLRQSKPASSRDNLSGTNLVRAGDHNQRVTLQAIRSFGPITRIGIAEITGLTAPSIANITKRLLADGLILQDGRILGARGQPASKFIANPDGAYALGLNIDRDHITLVAMDFTGNVLDRTSVETRFAMPDEVLAFLEREYARIVSKKIINSDRLIGLGIGLPDDLGHVQLPQKPPDYIQWSQIDVIGLFGKALKVAVYTENDATAAAIGELQFGDGLNRQNFIFTLISAGLGSGIIVNSQPYRGSHNRSGEIGFFPLSLQSDDTTSLQDRVSLYSLYEYLADRGLNVSTPAELMAADPTMKAAIFKWADAAEETLASTLLVINCVLNPEIHYLGGRLPAFILDRICEGLNRRFSLLMGRVPDIAPFRRAESSEDAAALGAAVVVLQNRLLPNPEALMKVANA
ncbi:MAG TPA: ROK family transcriptional regulator [Asticcacaulis sp.]|nr:ROK family transcriptional regulator [Asticcacaulis sp.]